MPKPVDDRLFSYVYVRDIHFNNTFDSGNQIISANVKFELRDQNRELIKIEEKHYDLYQSNKEYLNLEQIRDLLDNFLYPELYIDKLEYSDDIVYSLYNYGYGYNEEFNYITQFSE